jgi:hypothetical protein
MIQSPPDQIPRDSSTPTIGLQLSPAEPVATVAACGRPVIWPWSRRVIFVSEDKGEAWFLSDRQDKARLLALRFVSTLRQRLNDLSDAPLDLAQ